MTIWPSEHLLWEWQQTKVRVMPRPGLRLRISSLQGQLSASMVSTPSRVETGVLALGEQRSTGHPFLLASDPRTLLEQWPSPLLPQLGGHPKGPHQTATPCPSPSTGACIPFSFSLHLQHGCPSATTSLVSLMVGSWWGGWGKGLTKSTQCAQLSSGPWSPPPLSPPYAP